MAGITIVWLLLTLSLFTLLVNGSYNDSEIEQQLSDIKKISENFISKSNFNEYCDINDNCTESLVCLDNYCRCKPNHIWHNKTKNCQTYHCSDSINECKKYDENRECNNYEPVYALFGSKCECRSGFLEDKRSLKCRKHCFNNNDCSDQMVCVDFMCHNRPNYRFNQIIGIQPFNCTIDSNCWSNGDENRECSNGVCICNFQEDMISTKCYLTFYSLFRPRNYSTRKERLLICTLVIVPLVIIYCVYSDAKKRRSKKLLKQTILQKNQMNINYLYMTKNQEIKDMNKIVSQKN
ncbi:uncharacterized protein LOC128958443 [Oppia nitens]|uniref:uncharacterized protein LOC128958443 n=1 Tax=Oppia nitens TaxID=1686743 RepID=UPI0023DB4D23|nr:uncharacterized protein LOC128958443 [Oppia nitens]